MSRINMNALAENASRLGMRLQESFSEHTRDLNIGRASSALYLDGADDKSKNIRRQLDSSSDREKLDAMKRLVALISKGRNVSEYFAQVVKNVASHNLEIRKLVYIYLLRYAEAEPDLALLSINTFQKDLNDPSPLIRAMALRVLSGIRVPMIGSIVVLAIKKCAADFSPYVRKGAALAIPKCHELDPGHLPELITIITSLLNDRSPLSIGSVAVAFQAVCPTRLDLLHAQYRRLCRVLIDVDEWGQVELLNLLLRYARVMLPKPGDEEVDGDLRLLLSAAEPLLQSRNPAVVLAVTRTFYYAAPPSWLSKTTQPLLRLVAHSKEVERVVLTYLVVIAQQNPQHFAPYYTRFLIRSDDFRQTKQHKIKLLLLLLSAENYQAILREFIDYANDVDDVIVAETIHAVGQCSRLMPDCTHQCLTALTAMIRSPYDAIVSAAVLEMKSLVQKQLHAPSVLAQSPLTLIAYLAQRFDDIRNHRAKACVLWLVGQYAPAPENTKGVEGVAEWAPDVLRRAARTFGAEDVLVKLQTVTLAAKLLVLAPAARTLVLLARYVFSLARYDADYDVRDRGRMLAALLAGVAPGLVGDVAPDAEEQGGVVLRREQVRLVLFEGKVGSAEEDYVKVDDDRLTLGSLSLITGKDMHGDNILPDWLEEGIDPSLRDTAADLAPAPAVVPTAISSAQSQRFMPMGSSRASPTILTPTEGQSPAGSGIHGGPAKGPWTDLDKFYADDDAEEEEEEDSGSEEDGESEEEEVDDDEGVEEAPDGSEDGSEEEGNDEEEGHNVFAENHRDRPPDL